MAAIFSRYWKILTLDKKTFVDLKASEESLWFSIRLFLVLALLASLGSLARISPILEEPTLAERLQQLAAEVRAQSDRFPLLLGEPIQGFASTLDKAAANLEEIQPPLGYRPSRIIRLAGKWLGAPLGLLGSWMGATLAVWLAARWMGGQGSLRQHISLLLLAFTPQVLRFVQYLPANWRPPQAVVGLLVLTAWLWSLAIGVYALAIAHELSIRRSVLASSTAFFVFAMAIPEVVAFCLAMAGVVIWRLAVP